MLNIEYDSLKSWIRLILLFSLGITGTVGMWSVVVVMPAIESDFNIDRGKASLLYATTMVGFGLGNFLIGKIIDKYWVKITNNCCNINFSYFIPNWNDFNRILAFTNITNFYGNSCCYFFWPING